jgi:hypothetical protein
MIQYTLSAENQEHNESTKDWLLRSQECRDGIIEE